MEGGLECKGLFSSITDHANRTREHDCEAKPSPERKARKHPIRVSTSMMIQRREAGNAHAEDDGTNGMERYIHAASLRGSRTAPISVARNIAGRSRMMETFWTGFSGGASNDFIGTLSPS